MASPSAFLLGPIWTHWNGTQSDPFWHILDCSLGTQTYVLVIQACHRGPLCLQLWHANWVRSASFLSPEFLSPQGRNGSGDWSSVWGHSIYVLVSLVPLCSVERKRISSVSDHHCGVSLRPQPALHSGRPFPVTCGFWDILIRTTLSTIF